MVHLTIRDARGERSNLFAGWSVTLGHGEDCTVRLDATGVAAHHAEIVVRDGKLTLRDLGSTSGTFLGARRITIAGAVITPGDVLRMGMAEIEVGAGELPTDLPFPQPSQTRDIDVQRLVRAVQDGDGAAAAGLYREALRRNTPELAMWAIPFAVPSHTAWAALVLASRHWARSRVDEVVAHCDRWLERCQWPAAVRTAPPQWFGNLCDGVPEPLFLLVRHLVIDTERMGVARRHALRTEWVRNVAHLELRGRELDLADLQAMRVSEHLTRVSRWVLHGMPVRTSQLPTLVAVLDRLGALVELDLSQCRLTDEGIRQLARTTQLKQLTHLDLRDNGLGDDAATALARSPNVVNLEVIDLRGNPISLDGIRRLRTSVRFRDGALKYG